MGRSLINLDTEHSLPMVRQVYLLWRLIRLLQVKYIVIKSIIFPDLTFISLLLGGFGTGMRLTPQMTNKGRGGERICSVTPLS